MAASSSSSLRVLIVVLAVVSVSLRRAGATVTVDEACKQYTKEPELCVKSLSSATPEAKAEAEKQGGLAGLAELAVAQAVQCGLETVAFVKGLERMPGGMPPVCLNDCVAKFQLALANLQRSKVAVEQDTKDVGAVGNWLSSAKGDGDTCMADCQKVEGGGEIDIVDKVSDLSKMCAVAMSLTEASRKSAPAAA